MSGIFIANLTVQSISIDKQGTKTGIDEPALYSLKITEFFNKNGMEYPILNVDAPGSTGGIFDKDDVEQLIDQYECEMSMP
jgi:hypothetical protein